MPETRQPVPTAPPPGESTFRGGGWLPEGFHLDAHTHTQGQLLYAAAGAMATTTERGTWVAPFNRVTWTPPGFEHSHHLYGRTDVRLLDLPGELCGRLAAHPAVYEVTPLLREALLALTDQRDFRPGAADRLLAVVLDELVETPAHSLHLPEPVDDRLRAVTDVLHEDPAQTTTLAELGREVGASERTLSRLFHTELGMSFHRWRSVLRVHHALVLLTSGRSVIDTATECGWSNPSSLIEAFTAIVGQTPGRYQARLRDNAA